jgi:hypothetical protein
MSHILISLRNLASFMVGSVVVVALLFASFAFVEPLALKAQESVDITITQIITGETSFSVDPGNVTMDNQIASISGGTSNGTTSFTVQSNNSTGYNVVLSFSDDPAMQSTSTADFIPDYIEDTPGTPDYGFDAEASGGSAQFGFSVLSASSTIVATNFQDDGATSCGGGGSNTYAQCWSAGSTTAVAILNRGSATIGDGDDANVLFRVHVPPNPSPAVPTGGYVATATLTVAEN